MIEYKISFTSCKMGRKDNNEQTYQSTVICLGMLKYPEVKRWVVTFFNSYEFGTLIERVLETDTSSCLIHELVADNDYSHCRTTVIVSIDIKEAEVSRESSLSITHFHCLKFLPSPKNNEWGHQFFPYSSWHN